MAEQSEGSVQLITKVGALLRALEVKDQSAASLAEAIGEPRSSVYRLLRSLQALDWVDDGAARGTFRLGVGLVRLGAAARSGFDERTLALPIMEELHDATGETIFLCVRRGLQAICIERLDGRRVTVLALTIGGSLPLHVGAAPRALLAHAPAEIAAEWDRVARTEGLERLTKNSPVTVRAVQRELDAIRRKGYALSDQDVTIGVAAYGVPVFDYTGAVRAALSVSGIRDAILDPDSGVLDQLVDAGGRLSRALGWRGEALASAVADT
jgi:DNA-binding IclR family transcriptional regulator